METLIEHEQHGLSEESCPLVVSVGEIAALENRIERTVELVRNLCQALTAAEERAAHHEGRVASAEERATQSETRATQAEEWAANAEAHVREYAPMVEQMQNDLNALRGERDNVRQRVEYMLAEVRAYAPMVEQMQNDLNALHGERDNVRQRVERMLAQLDALEVLRDQSLEDRAAALATT